MVSVVGRIGFEGPGFFDGVAVRSEEGGVAAAAHVVGGGEEEERRGVGGGVHVGEGLPVDGGGGLGVLMHDFAVGALAMDEELELGFGEGEIAVAVDGVEGVEGIAAEEPAEAGAGGVGGGEVAGDEGGLFRIPGPRKRGTVGTQSGWRRGALAGDGLSLELLDGDDGPLEGFVEGLVGRGDGCGMGEQVLPRLAVGRVESGDLGVELRESCGERGVGCGGGRDAGGHQ